MRGAVSELRLDVPGIRVGCLGGWKWSRRKRMGPELGRGCGVGRVRDTLGDLVADWV